MYLSLFLYCRLYFNKRSVLCYWDWKKNHYNNFYSASTISTSESNKKEKSITNRLFKRNRITEIDEFQTYILLPTCNKELINKKRNRLEDSIIESCILCRNL